MKQNGQSIAHVSAVPDFSVLSSLGMQARNSQFKMVVDLGNASQAK